MENRLLIKKNNKGFTLVELIVVLVILAILAAILVPALLGYIDEAKYKQDIINAKACMTAIQSELVKQYAYYSPSDFTGASSAEKRCIFYGKDEINARENDCLMNNSNFTKNVLEKAGVDEPFLLIMFTRKQDLSGVVDVSTVRDSFRCYSIVYWSSQDSEPFVYNFETGDWEIGNLYTCGLMARGSSGNKVLKGKYINHEIKHYVLTYKTAIDGATVNYSNFKGSPNGKYVKLNDYFDQHYK